MISLGPLYYISWDPNPRTQTKIEQRNNSTNPKIPFKTAFDKKASNKNSDSDLVPRQICPNRNTILNIIHAELTLYPGWDRGEGGTFTVEWLFREPEGSAQ